MNAISLGPIAFDGARFAAVLAIGVFLAATRLIGRSASKRNERWATLVVLAWILGARAGFVLKHWADYETVPLDIFRVWQGGFLASAGWGAAALVVASIALHIGLKASLPLFTSAALASAAQLAALSLHSEGAPDLPSESLLALDGDVLELVPGPPLVLNLWASWCPPCRREMPMMQDLAATQPGVDFIFANQGESASEIARFIKRAGLDADDIFRDPSSALMQELKAVGLPSTLVFNTHGQLVASHTGEISRAGLRGMILKVKKGLP
ncbi:TlpA disulfide reductase family protein [Salipiger mangrovisoli]|uniref:TlpA family protein disulfide reductase n=1 Tax=Salipiger mangrovisoli TaxID=2865933 RepID=A0ABR9X6L1_9RHOB|nr:TlpA disulfide reductase family protein [Salipiger mangrovisoli]MBE9639249.1 TlpA family protein disulfide reductase [Salipiger mangrovisoli]